MLLKSVSLSFLVATVLCVLSPVCAHGAPAGAPASAESRKAFTLALPRAPTGNETVWVRVAAGVLPPGARLVVRTSDGEIAGTIVPFGIRPGQKAGVYTIPIPENAAVDGKLFLLMEIEEKDSGTVRVPAPEEVEEVSVVLAPVTGDH